MKDTEEIMEEVITFKVTVMEESDEVVEEKTIEKR